MSDTGFNYSYSAKVNKEVDDIRKKYLVEEESKLDRLKRLDRLVAGAGMMQSLCAGVIGALIFGIGMCMGLGTLNGGMAVAVIFGVIGSLIMITAYPIYAVCVRRAKKKYVPEILRLADELSKEK